MKGIIPVNPKMKREVIGIRLVEICRNSINMANLFKIIFKKKSQLIILNRIEDKII
jgi:hypothetical protein